MSNATEYLTPEQAAVILNVSPMTVMRKFEQRKGVLDLGTPETRHKRRRRILRIPREVFDAYVHEVRIR